MVFFNFWIFLLFFFNFPFHVGEERNGVIIFIFSLSQHFPTYFGLGWIRNGIFQFFCYFFLNFLLPIRKERNVAIIFIFSLSQRFPTYFSLEWSRNGVFQFLNFFAIFFEFSLPRRGGTKWSDNFYFLSFSAFSHLFWLGMNP